MNCCVQAVPIQFKRTGRTPPASSLRPQAVYDTTSQLPPPSREMHLKLGSKSFGFDTQSSAYALVKEQPPSEPRGFRRRSLRDSELGTVRRRPSAVKGQCPVSSPSFRWSRPGSNRQPLPCKGSALPVELRPRSFKLRHASPVAPPGHARPDESPQQPPPPCVAFHSITAATTTTSRTTTEAIATIPRPKHETSLAADWARQESNL